MAMNALPDPETNVQGEVGEIALAHFMTFFCMHVRIDSQTRTSMPTSILPSTARSIFRHRRERKSCAVLDCGQFVGLSKKNHH